MNMNALAVVTLLLCCILVPHLVQTAPTGAAFKPLPAFKEAAERAKTLVEKILRDLPVMHAATIHAEGLSLDPVDQMANLQMMVETLHLPAAPALNQLSDIFTLDVCVRRMIAGCRLYQGLLEILSNKLNGLNDLLADLRDLLTQIVKMKEAAEVQDGDMDQKHELEFANHLQGSFEVQVATHLTLSQLRSFCHDLFRSLRALTTQRHLPVSMS